MEDTHDCESTYAIRHNSKLDTRSVGNCDLLSKEKEIKRLSENPCIVGNLQQYTQIPTDLYTEGIPNNQQESSNLIPAEDSAFSPVRRKPEEPLVSSTTRSPCDSSTHRHTSSPRHEELRHQKRRYGRPNKIVETAAATSTTTFDDDEERLQTQTIATRGRRGVTVNEVTPPSCGTPLDKIKEEQASSTAPDIRDRKLNEKNTKPGKPNDCEFLKPADVPPNSNPSVSASQTQLFGNSSNYEGLDRHPSYPLPGMYPSIDGQIRDARYSLDPRHMHMHGNPGLGGSPILSDVSLIPLSPQPMSGIGGPGGGNPFNPNSSLEFYMSGLTSPTMSMLSQARNLSPRHSITELEKMNYPFYGTQAGMPTSGQSSQGHVPPFSSQRMSPLAYYQLMQQQQRLLAMSLEKPDEFGRFPSPLCRSRARKRPLSISPAFSDNLDITAMIRTSPNSLLPFVNGGLSNSRSSSAASGGSYGHLAAGGISPSGYLSGYNTPMMTSPQQLQFLSRQMSFSGHMGSVNHFNPTMDKSQSSSAIPNPFHHMPTSSRGYQGHNPPHVSDKKMPSQSHSNVQNVKEGKIISKHGQEQISPSVNYNSNNSNNIGVSPASHVTNDDNEVYETKCDWEKCSLDFDTQEQLVNHINNDHIHGDKKEFVCRWRNCARDQRPFKAQYMLVVHMRRHTGEKPHKCTFKGCTKAYSRLENLKTHLRSHTGEKPYVCEFPSCTKAFSNASDRAKHQNRTHSNEKPYACKISGCTKRYTDPSSLRKHVKTVHGPEAHVTKRMKANREREEKKTEVNVKQEPGVEKEKRKLENETSQNCHSVTRVSGPHSNDTNPPSNLNPRSNQSSYTSGSDMTPQNSPHMTSQNNDSGVDVNVGANDADSDGDIVVDENPLPDSTSGGIGLQSRRRNVIRNSLVPRLFNKKMQNLSIRNKSGTDQQLGEYPSRNVEAKNQINERMSKQGGGVTEVSSTTINEKMRSKIKSPGLINSSTTTTRRQMAILNQDRRDSGTVSDVSRKSSMASQSSRRSSQMSNCGINVAGSYDPISLDSSRRSSSISNAQGPSHSGSNSSLSAINPHQLYRLRSKYNEMTGLPPPTPIANDSYSKGQMGRWLKDEDNYRSSSKQSTGCHQSNFYQPAPPSMGPPHPPGEPCGRRRSDGSYMKSVKSPLSNEMPSQSSRRASDPVRKATQMDPAKLPTVQRYNSWNNITPLPNIGTRNNGSGQPYPLQYNNNNNHCNLKTPKRSDGNGNYFNNENKYQSNGGHIAMHKKTQQHHAHPSTQPYHPQRGVNEHILMNNLNTDMMTESHPGMNSPAKHQYSYGNVMSPNSNMTPHQRTAKPRQQSLPVESYDSMNSPRSFHGSMNSVPQSNSMMPGRQPENLQYNNNLQMHQDYGYGNPEINDRMMNERTSFPQNPNNQFSNYLNYQNNHNVYNHPYSNPSISHYPGQGPVMQMHDQLNHSNVNGLHNAPVSSHQNIVQSHFAGNGMPVSSALTPRPPSNINTANQNRIRISRLRHSGGAAITTDSLTSSSGNPSGPHPRNGNRINCTPDAQIPDEFLQQEFIDSIPELQPELINNINGSEENQAYVKMAADSTTGPDGHDDENDDAMSGTNTDVTLPPMSAFSSRIATPLLNNPFPPQHPLAGVQHPASNMAINSMSSMLSALQEENKYLNMIPPQ